MDEKICRVCGRPFAWRKAWAADWEQRTVCSAGCRRAGIRPFDRRIEQEMLSLLAERGASKTACPSEVARRVQPDDWRPLMERVRRAARRLAAQGRVEVLQRGQVVDPGRVKGPIRLRATRLLDPRP